MYGECLLGIGSAVTHSLHTVVSVETIDVY